jgi:hypothetical protein
VHSCEVDHAPIVTAAQTVTDLIVNAAQAVSAH